MRHSLASALSLGAVILLLGACSSSSDQPAAKAEAAPAADTQAAPPPGPDRAVQAGPAGRAPRAPALTGPATPVPMQYACTGTKDALTVTHATNGATARISFGKTAVSGKRAGTGHYTAAKADLVEKGNAATLTWNGKKYSCKLRG